MRDKAHIGPDRGFLRQNIAGVRTGEHGKGYGRSQQSAGLCRELWHHELEQRTEKPDVAEKQADDTELSKEEFFARVDEAREQIRQGEAHSFATVEELDKYIRSL